MIRIARRPVALVLAAPLLVGWSFFDAFHRNVEEGNQRAETGEADAALQHYDEAQRVNPSSPIPDFNRGLVHSGQGDVEAARDAYLSAAASEDAAIASDALYNLGNLFTENQDYENAINAYLQSLDRDPTDADARRNLEIALRQQQQQQEQQQQEQQQDEENDDPNEDEQENQQEQPNEDEQDESEQEQPESPQPEQNEQPEEQEPEQEQAPQPQEQFSREDAERLLNAVQTDELKVLEELQDEQEAQAVSANDW